MRRREFLEKSAWGATGAILARSLPGFAWSDAKSGTLTAQSADQSGLIDLVIDEPPFSVNGRRGNVIALNGSLLGPLLRLANSSRKPWRCDSSLAILEMLHRDATPIPYFRFFEGGIRRKRHLSEADRRTRSAVLPSSARSSIAFPWIFITTSPGFSVSIVR